MKAQVEGAAQWLAFSCGVKTTMVLSVREKRGKSAVKERTQWDASSELFIRKHHCECLHPAYSLGFLSGQN